MTPARKSKLFTWWFARHAEGRLRQTFALVQAQGIAETMAAARQGPLLVVSNHCSWWDPMVALYLVPRHLHLDGYAMMDERNLRALPFFGKVGAFGVNLSSGGAADSSLKYASSLLDRPGRLVWIFPQGAERASSQRPLGFRRGSAVVACQAPTARVVPLAIRYEMAGDEQPWLFISLGSPQAPAANVDDERDRQETSVTAELDELDRRITHLRQGRNRHIDGFEVLLRRPPSRWASAAQNMLAWFTRPRHPRRAAGPQSSRSVRPSGRDAGSEPATTPPTR